MARTRSPLDCDDCLRLSENEAKRRGRPLDYLELPKKCPDHGGYDCT